MITTKIIAEAIAEAKKLGLYKDYDIALSIKVALKKEGLDIYKTRKGKKVDTDQSLNTEK